MPDNLSPTWDAVTADTLNAKPSLWDMTVKSSISNAGSFTVTGDKSYQIRQPGNGSSTADVRVWSDIINFRTGQSGSVKFSLSNITIDNNSNALFSFGLTDAPDSLGTGSATDAVSGNVRGDGEIESTTKDGGSSSTSNNTSKGNTYVSNLNTVTISWDGSSDFTITTDDGSSTVSVTESGNYPTNTELMLRVTATDVLGTAAVNADADITDIQ